MFTASSNKNAQVYCQPAKDSICNKLPHHTHDKDHFHHPHVLKLASGIHTELTLNRDKKHKEKLKKKPKKLLQRQNIQSQINSRFKRASNLKKKNIFFILNFVIQKRIS